MNFDYSERGKVKIDMIPYMKDMLEEFPKKLQENETAVTPAADNQLASFATLRWSIALRRSYVSLTLRGMTWASQRTAHPTTCWLLAL